jgi:hypothetical protein
MKPPRPPKLCPCGVTQAHSPQYCAWADLGYRKHYFSFNPYCVEHCFWCAIMNGDRIYSYETANRIFREAGWTGHDGRKPGGMK